MAVHWRNRGRSASAVFADLVDLDDEAEAADQVVRAAREGYRVRPLGSSHSSAPLAVTDGIAVRWAGPPRLLRHAGSQVTVSAGTRLRDLPDLLEPLGLALANQGQIDSRSVAGAISAGAHGTGTRFRGLSAQVSALRMVLADGSVVDCSSSLRPNLFEAARAGLGALGIITDVTLECVPAFALSSDEHPEPLPAVLDTFEVRMSAADHVQFSWFPHTDVALVKSADRLPLDEGYRGQSLWRRLLDDRVSGSAAHSLTSTVGSLVPAAVPRLNEWRARSAPRRCYSAPAHDVFAAPRRVPYKGMEYAIPRGHVPDVLRAVRSHIERHDLRISFPIQVRTAAADDVWLSAAYGRDVAYVAVYRYARDPFAAYFLAVEQIVRSAGGRPHLGMLHTLGHEELAALYPRLEEVRRVRRAVDPGGLFANEYVDRVIGTV